MLNWVDLFNNVLANNTRIRQCCVCGDLLYCSDKVSEKDFGWATLGSSDHYVCCTCQNGVNDYITKKDARFLDKRNKRILGTVIDKELGRPYRSQCTWDEHKKYNREYKEALKDFLLENDMQCYTTNEWFFTDLKNLNR